MKSLAQIISDLDSIISDLNLTSVEVQALKLFLANAIYQNEALGSSIALEGNPLTCVNLNSAIMHAAKNKYKVFRGKNPRMTIVGLAPTQDFSVKKYDTFAEVQGYKFVYAEDYDFVYSVNPALKPINLILTKDTIEGSFDAVNQYSYDIPNSLSEDLMLYDLPDGDPNNRSEILLKDLVNADDDTSAVYQLTISDFEVKLLSIGKFTERGTHYYIGLPLIKEDVHLSELVLAISSVPYFMSMNLEPSSIASEGYSIITSNTELGFSAVTQYTNRGTGYTEYYDFVEDVMEPEKDLDKIFLNSVTQYNTGNSIKTTSDVNDVIAKLTVEYFDKVDCHITNNDTLIVYYTLKNPNNAPNAAWFDKLIGEIQKVYYNDSLIIEAGNFNPAPLFTNWETSPSLVTIEYSSNDKIDSIISELIHQYQSTILGGSFYPYELLFYIQQNMNGNLTMLRPKDDTNTKNFMSKVESLSVGEVRYTIDLTQINIKRI